MFTDTTITVSSIEDDAEPHVQNIEKSSTDVILEPTLSDNILRGLPFIYASILYCMTTFFQASISPITDVLQNEFNVTLSQIGFLASSYFISKLAMQIPYGIIIQKYSYSQTLLIISIGLTITFTLFGLAESFISLLIVRIICGIFGSPTFLLIVTTAGHRFSNNDIQFVASISCIIAYVVTFFAVAVQAWIYETYQIWRETFYILGFMNGVIVIAQSITMYIEYRQNTIDTKQNDDNEESQETQVKVITKLEEMEEKSKRNSNLSKVLRNYLNWSVGICGFSQWTTFMAIFGLWLIPYLMIKFEFTRIMAAIGAGIGTLSTGIGCVLFGYFARKYKKRRMLLFISQCLLSTLFIVLYVDKTMKNEIVIFIIIAISGLGVGSTNILFTLVREYNTNNECQETSTSFINFFTVSSGLIPQYVIGLLLDYHHDQSNIQNHENEQYYHVQDFQFAFSCIIPTCFVMSVITTYILKETNGKNM
eukprot:540337_1